MTIKYIFARLNKKNSNNVKDDTALFFITLSSNNLDEDIKKLEDYSDCYHKLMDGLVCFVERHSTGSLSAIDIREEVLKILGDDVFAFVVRCDKYNAAWYMAEDSCKWLKEHA